MKHNLLGFSPLRPPSPSPVSMFWVSNLSAGWSRCNLQTHQHWSKGWRGGGENHRRRRGGENFCKKWLSQYILWLVVLIFQVLKSNIWRKKENYRMKLYFLEMTCQSLPYHVSKKWKIRKSIITGVTMPFSLSSGFCLMVGYLRTVKMVCIEVG